MHETHILCRNSRLMGNSEHVWNFDGQPIYLKLCVLQNFFGNGIMGLGMGSWGWEWDHGKGSARHNYVD